MDEEIRASHLELCLKFGKPSAEDENFLWGIVIFL
jgi:hypothetical protein